MWAFVEIAGKIYTKNNKQNQPNNFKRIEIEDKIVCVISRSKIGMKLEEKQASYCSVAFRFNKVGNKWKLFETLSSNMSGVFFIFVCCVLRTFDSKQIINAFRISCMPQTTDEICFSIFCLYSFFASKGFCYFDSMP